MMVLKLAHRNIWRNKRRSLIVIISVAVGITATILTDTLSMGMIFQIFDNQLGSHVAHLQIHKKGFNDNRIIQNYLPDSKRIEKALEPYSEQFSFSRRVMTFGLLSSASSSSGVSIIGIEPDKEEQVTKIKKSVTAGTYLTGAFNEIIIGRDLAEKLDVRVGDKVVALASTLQGHVGSDVFRIVGLYETFSSEFDKSFIYISLGNAQRMLSMEENISEFAILLNDREKADELKALFANELGVEYEVLTYADILPLMLVQIDMYQQSMIIFYVIIGIALILGIINTMLMSVFERIQEFGVLMAIGMRNRSLFTMIILEAFLLGIIGTVLGFGIGYILYLPLTVHGLDLSMFSAGLKSFGTGAVIYPVLTMTGIINALTLIPLMTVLGALYPALRAIRLQPISAIRFV